MLSLCPTLCGAGNTFVGLAILLCSADVLFYMVSTLLRDCGAGNASVLYSSMWLVLWLSAAWLRDCIAGTVMHLSRIQFDGKQHPRFHLHHFSCMCTSQSTSKHICTPGKKFKNTVSYFNISISWRSITIVHCSWKMTKLNKVHPQTACLHPEREPKDVTAGCNLDQHPASKLRHCIWNYGPASVSRIKMCQNF